MSKQLAQYYKALSNPVRLDVFMHVVDHSTGTAPKKKTVSCVCEISDALKVPQPTISNHLRVLENAKLVKSVKVGTKCYQYVTKKASEELLENAKYFYKQAHKNPY